MISNDDFPNEPSIMMDPKSPNVLIGGSNLNNYYVSTDTGHTWVKEDLVSSFGVWGDPVISVDTAGHFYFFHLMPFLSSFRNPAERLLNGSYLFSTLPV